MSGQCMVILKGKEISGLVIPGLGSLMQIPSPANNTSIRIQEQNQQREYGLRSMLVQ
ncbi:hypothetical protein GIB67_041265 [Kingdonia uniflora]|uniref:Uncharacterized protein n=1 Tax=Kingdonia uniflora TaxID=39325 RepID=A0A7J7NJ24_9MAGN|nr:hypothetical protein GIB67_041265 [Kingdonia uniflora]